jgi:hypothetical protein
MAADPSTSDDQKDFRKYCLSDERGVLRVREAGNDSSEH